MKISIRAGLVLGGVSIGMKAVVCMSKQFVNSEALINKKSNGEVAQASEMDLRKVQSKFVYVKKSKNQTHYVKKSKNQKGKTKKQSEFVYLKKGKKLKEKQKKMKVISSVKKNKKLKSGKKSQGVPCYNGNSTTINEGKNPEKRFDVTVPKCLKKNGKTFTLKDLDTCVKDFLKRDFKAENFTQAENFNIKLPAYGKLDVEKTMYVSGSGSGYQLRYTLAEVEFANLVFHFDSDGYIYYISGEAVKTDEKVCKLKLISEAEAKDVAVKEFSKKFQSNEFKDVSQYNFLVRGKKAFDPNEGVTEAFSILIELKDDERKRLKESDVCKPPGMPTVVPPSMNPICAPLKHTHEHTHESYGLLHNTPTPSVSPSMHPTCASPEHSHEHSHESTGILHKTNKPLSTPTSPPSRSAGENPVPNPLMNECFPFVQNYYVNRCSGEIFLERPSSHQVLKPSGPTASTAPTTAPNTAPTTAPTAQIIYSRGLLEWNDRPSRGTK
eukprot:CAMPEP_0194302618 /NCGR_PEP_ID=MMETSP0171-20130528/462_1 /TAXON_ID=218684 /ORGANISM="Corethron pennatum, Strain L29A3" /LENGTH=494 /DNA_ID=CAMNT_0039053153 /DNA_START=350 /DNA_END=1831 /DNA_ORIENTATION=-